MSRWDRFFGAIVLGACLCTLVNTAFGGGRSADRDDDGAALARLLVKRAADSLKARRLGLALLQYEQARLWHGPTADAASVRPSLARAAAAEAALIARGAEAADRRDLAAVQTVVAELRRLDVHSAPALELALRYQAALADRGGAFQRLQWKDVTSSPRHPEAKEP